MTGSAQVSLPASAARRFSLEAVIGRGAQGVVYRALDRSTGWRVALKHVCGVDPNAIAQLKHEFRIAADIAHPHVVQLLELFFDDDAACFSMELVEGLDLDRAFALERALDHAVLLQAARDVLGAVAALHARGIAHGDLKPSNVVLTPAGRAVLVDFGVARRTSARGIRSGGTRAYAAPERLAGDGPTLEADLWSLGAIVHRALTGSPPSATRSAAIETHSAPRPANSLDLAALARRLLHPDPRRRPTLDEIADALGVSISPRCSPPTAPAPSQSVFVGRLAERERLNAELEAAQVRPGRVVWITGPSGSGKSALARHFAEMLERRTVTVLRARCDTREEVPHRAVDGWIDELADRIGRDPVLQHATEALERRHISAMFPVLRTLRSPPASGADTLESTDARRRAFEELGAILRAVAFARGPIVAIIDDIQGADSDSEVLLRAVLQDERALAMVVLICRAEERESAPARRFFKLVNGSSIELDRLGTPDIEALIWSLAPAADAERVRRLARQAAGNPLFAELLARNSAHAYVELSELLNGIVGSLDAPTRKVLAHLARSTVALKLEDLSAACTDRDPRVLVARLCAARLARVVGEGAGRRYEVQHALVAEAALRCERSSEFSVHSEQEGESVAELLASARGAASSLAYLRAASLYERACAEQPPGPERSTTWEALGDAYSAAGMGERAVGAYNQASAEADSPRERLRLRRIAAEQALRAGLRERGMRLVREIVEQSGMPWPSIPVALTRVIAHRATPSWWRFAQRGPRDPDRLAVAWSVGLGLSLFDPLRGAHYHAIHAGLAQAEGDDGHLARSFVTDAVLRAMMSSSSRDRGDAATRLAEGAALAARSDDPGARLHAAVMSAALAFLIHRDTVVLEIAESAFEEAREARSSVHWELANLHWFRLASMARLGRFEDVTEALERELRRASDRGDAYAALLLPLGWPMLAWIARGDTERIIHRCTGVLESSGAGAYLLHFASFSLVRAHLASCDPERALARAEEALARAGRAGTLRFTQVRLESLEQRALAALALAGQLTTHHERRAPLIAMASSDAARVAKIDDEPARAIAASIRSGVARAEGDGETAQREATEAAIRFEMLGWHWRASLERSPWHRQSDRVSGALARAFTTAR